MLKAGWCTVQFNAFLQYKMPTQTVRGGNLDDFYAKEGTLPKSRMLVQEHPDVATLVWKFGRYHHHVDYRRFRILRLIPKADAPRLTGVNDYGMALERVTPRRLFRG